MNYAVAFRSFENTREKAVKPVHVLFQRKQEGRNTNIIVLCGSSTKSNQYLVLFCSNLGYALIARVLAEKFANNDYEGWVQRNIFYPLGMTNTGFDLGR